MLDRNDGRRREHTGGAREFFFSIFSTCFFFKWVNREENVGVGGVGGIKTSREIKVIFIYECRERENKKDGREEKKEPEANFPSGSLSHHSSGIFILVYTMYIYSIYPLLNF